MNRLRGHLQRPRRSRTAAAALALFLLIVGNANALAQSTVKVDAAACFTTLSSGGIYPLAISVDNAGPVATGAVVVQSVDFMGNDHDYAYPVTLPAGSQSQLFAYPLVSYNVLNLTVKFEGNAQSDSATVPVPYKTGTLIGYIGDDTGAIEALNGVPASRAGAPTQDYNRQSLANTYANPEDAPDRAIGYLGLYALVIGNGAERMSLKQWNAIYHWVLDGGSLILLGGSNAEYLQAAGVQPLAPITDPQHSVLPRLSELEWTSQAELKAAVPKGPVPITYGTPTSGAVLGCSQRGRSILVQRRLGAGTVLFVAFDPSQLPFLGSRIQPDVWRLILASTLPSISTDTLAGLYDPSNSPFVKPSPSASASEDPFQVRVPPVSQIVWIFIAYFVLVVPVTFIVLRRAGKPDWAWVTSPLLSIAFVYVLYLFTADLHRAGLSRRTAGVIVGEAGSPDAYFQGYTEFFFPKEGSYKVAVPGAEMIERTSPEMDISGDDYFVVGAGGLGGLNTLDRGAAELRNLSVGNLAFRRLFHREPLSLGRGIGASVSMDKHRTVRVGLTNHSAFDLKSCLLYLPHQVTAIRIGDLRPGAGWIGSSGAASRTTGLFGGDLVSASPLLGSERTAFLEATLDGASFGPNIGVDVGSEHSVHLLISIPIRQMRATK